MYVAYVRPTSYLCTIPDVVLSVTLGSILAAYSVEASVLLCVPGVL